MKCQNVAQVKWTSVRERVAKLNPGLADAMDKVAKRLRNVRLYEARYRYGNLIANRGALVPPPCDSRELAPCTECSALHSAGGNNTSRLPMMLILENCAEVFTSDGLHSAVQRRTIPLNLLQQGELFGVFETSDRMIERPQWSPWWVSAGARSVMVLAELGNAKTAQQINKAVGTTVVSTQSKHRPAAWELIKHVSSCLTEDDGSPTQWQTTVLIIPDEWLLAPEAEALKALVLATAWRQVDELRRQMIDDFHSAHAQLLPAAVGVDQQYYHATLRHLVAIAIGRMPAFEPVTPARAAGPFTSFQRFLVSKQIGSHFPAMLQPALLANSGNAGYYSFACPTLLHPLRSDRKDHGRTFQGFMDLVRNQLASYAERAGRVDMSSTQYVYKTVRVGKTRYDFDVSTANLLKNDFAFDQSSAPLDINLDSQFFEACVRIIRK